MNRYDELKERQRKEFDQFPLGVAFSNEQFKKMMERWGLTENDTDKIYSVGGGCFIRKSDKEEFFSTLDRFDKELKDAIDKDDTGEGFVKEMFLSELANHEYGYTHELDETLDALAFTIEEVKVSPKLTKGLKLALRHFVDYDVEF